jgi:hypothetical protein
MSDTARAYVYAGNWVADCPRKCGNVEMLYEKLRPRGPMVRKKTEYRCSYCQYVTGSIDWPPDEQALMEVLIRRPVPHTRNWYPQDHTVAVKSRIPHGQSVRDLLDENHEHGVD